MSTKQPAMEKESPPAFVFEGFEPANTTPVPDVLFDELLTELSGTELKVLLYIIRRTLGFKKSSDGISLTQFTDGITTKDGRVLDKGCGIKKRSTVSKTLRDLIAKECVESEKNKTDLGDDAVTVYRVHFKGVVAKSALPSPQTATTVVPKQPLPGGPQTATTGSADLATHKKQLARNSKQETVIQEGTYGESGEDAASDAHASTPTQSPEPYVLNYNASQDKTHPIVNDTPGEPHAVPDDQCDHSGQLDGSVPVDLRGLSGPSQIPEVAQGSGYRQAEQQMSAFPVSSPQASAKVEPPVPTGKPHLTISGSQVREWYEIIRACRLRMTANNVNAFNALAEEDGMTFENLKGVLDLHDSDQWVKDHSIPIGPQELADEKSKWRFERWMPVVVRNRPKPASITGPKSVSNLPSFGGMSDAEYYASLKRGNERERTAHAR